jgi:hypothetical protein
MHFLHITNHPGTTRNIQNVFSYLGSEIGSLETQKCAFPLHITETHSDQIWADYQVREYASPPKTLIFTDTCMFARPFLQHIEDHSMNIIVYVTNRFDWGAWHIHDATYATQYAEYSLHPRVFFLADNRYDQFYASIIHGLHFRLPDIIRLTPLISQNYFEGSGESKEKIMIHNSKLFIYNRGTFLHFYQHLLPFSPQEYDVYGYQGYPRYQDEYHISEYLGFLHLPYQTNIQSLWENVGHGIFYFIPSKAFLLELIQEPWYYWEEKCKSPELCAKSIDLAEWYQPENSVFFVFFDSWTDLKEKRDIFLEDNTAIYYKKKHISMQLMESNRVALAKWKDVFSSLVLVDSTMQENQNLVLVVDLGEHEIV